MRNGVVAALVALLVTALVPNAVLAQPAAPEPKPVSVVVNLAEGDSIKGRLIKADSEAVVVDIGAGETTIKTAKIVSIVFQPTGNSAPATAEKSDEKGKQAAAIEKIISAVRRLDNAVDVGVTFQNYSSLLIENKSVVDDNLKDIPESPFRSEIEQALLDYQYAMSTWNLAVANKWTVFYPRQEPGRTLVTKYGAPFKTNAFSRMPVMTGLNYVWLSARNHFNQAIAASKK